MTIGERIRAERKKKGWTQKRLGEECGIAEPTIRSYELGRLNPKKETIEKIAHALGVWPSDLIPDDQYSMIMKAIFDAGIGTFSSLGSKNNPEDIYELDFFEPDATVRIAYKDFEPIALKVLQDAEDKKNKYIQKRLYLELQDYVVKD